MDTGELLRRYAENGLDFQQLDSQVEATTQYLRNTSPLLDLVAIQVSQQLIKIYGQELDQQITSDIILTYLKPLVLDYFEKRNLWEASAREIWSTLIFRVIQDLQGDLGTSMLESLDWQTFNELLFQYVLNQNADLLVPRINALEKFHAQAIATKLIQDLHLINQPLSALKKRLGLRAESEDSPANKQTSLSSSQWVAESLADLPAINGFSAQLQADLWRSEARSIAFARYQAQHNPHHYSLKHHIVSPGDIKAFPWEVAEQITSKFGVNTVKLHLLLAAHTIQQITPWESTFTLKASDLISELGWDRPSRVDLPLKLNQIAGLAHTLSCLMVQAVWIEDPGCDSMQISIPTGRFWDILIRPQGQLDWKTGRIEQPDEVYLIIRPGLWISQFLHQTSGIAAQTLCQFGYLALTLLLEPAETELTLRLVIYLMLSIRLRACEPNPYEYQVKQLLLAILPEETVQQVQQSSDHARMLLERWNHALALLRLSGWYSEEQPDWFDSSDRGFIFYTKPYPRWLEPESEQRKPRGWIDYWLDQKLVIKPPTLLPQQITALIRLNSSQASTLPTVQPLLAGSEVRAARQAKKLTQSELANLLQVNQSLIARIESGDRTISAALVEPLRQLLDL